MTERNIDTRTLAYVSRVIQALSEIDGAQSGRYDILSVRAEVMFEGEPIGIRIVPSEFSETDYEMAVSGGFDG